MRHYDPHHPDRGLRESAVAAPRFNSAVATRLAGLPAIHWRSQNQVEMRGRTAILRGVVATEHDRVPGSSGRPLDLFRRPEPQEARGIRGNDEPVTPAPGLSKRPHRHNPPGSTPAGPTSAMIAPSSGTALCYRFPGVRITPVTRLGTRRKPCICTTFSRRFYAPDWLLGPDCSCPPPVSVPCPAPCARQTSRSTSPRSSNASAPRRPRARCATPAIDPPPDNAYRNDCAKLESAQGEGIEGCRSQAGHIARRCG